MKRRRQPPRRGAGGGPPREGPGGRVGATLEVTVERILPGGVGLAHAEGQTVLVGLAAPGDRLRVRVERARGKTLFASLVEVLAPSPARVEPPCPYFGRCGGCDFQQLNYAAQLDAKAEIIRDSLRRVGHLEPPADISVTPSPAEWRYRSRARWQHDARRGALGYYERGSHRVCDVVECPVAAPAVQARLTSLRESLREGALPEDFQEFEAVEGDDGVALRPSLGAPDEGEQQRLIGGERYRFDAGCFFQINHALLEPLVRAGLGDAAGETALDLYCGVGLFTLPLARRFARVRAVEGHPASAAYARRNLSDAGLSNAAVETSAVGDWLRAHADELPRPDFLLLDPPRTGAEPETVAAILSLRPPRLSYVSCDPATLARDLHALTDGGYRLATLQAFDMFPQTHHVETVVHLSRS
jgi:23S rRNA (uracil1939-C5)-methyltransferase